MMGRFASTVILFLVPSLSQAGWAESMFSALEHDWGSVARGTQLSHQFTISNNTGQTVRIRGVKPSCHCVSPMIGEYVIEPGQSTVLDVRMNTSVFMGSKTVTVTVSFQSPRRAEMFLRVSAVSSGNPTSAANEVDFGVVVAGKKVEKKLLLDFTTSGNVTITGVDFNRERMEAKYVELSRNAESVRYELTLGLTPMQSGNIEEKLRFKTNDPKSPEVLVLAKAVVENRLSLAPGVFKVASTSPGQQVTRTVLIKAQAPFRLLKVTRTNGLFGVKSGGEDRTTQMVVITMTMPSDTSKIPDHLEIETNLADSPTISLPIVVEGQIADRRP